MRVLFRKNLKLGRPEVWIVFVFSGGLGWNRSNDGTTSIVNP